MRINFPNECSCRITPCTICLLQKGRGGCPPPPVLSGYRCRIANLIFLDLHPLVPSGPARYHPDANKAAPSRNLTLVVAVILKQKTNSGLHSGLVGAATALSLRRPREASQSWGCADTARVPAMFMLPRLTLEVTQSGVSLGPDSSPQHRTLPPLPSL